jgi:phospholipid/cholesterol/gamma-HCH transport system substrate-binding protein
VNPQRITVSRILAVFGFSVSCFVLFLVLWLTSGGPTPLKPARYQVHVLLPNAKGLGQHSDVRVSGVTVGYVVSVRAASPAGLGRADVLIELKPAVVPLHADARAMVRSKSILGEAYVALTLGTKDAAALPEGGRLALRQGLPSVLPDEIFGAYDPKTRAAVRTWMQTEGPAVERRQLDLNAAAGTLRPWAIDANAMLATVDRQSGAVRGLLADGGAVADALANRGRAIRELATSGRTAFDTTGREGASLAAFFRALPGFERDAAATLRALTAFSSADAANVGAVRDEVAPLSPALRALGADAPALRTVVERTPPLAGAARSGLPAVDRLLRALPQPLATLDPLLRSFNPALRYLSAGRGDVLGFVANLAAATQSSTATPNGDEPLHYLRAMPVLSPAALGPLGRRPGATRANAYPPPGAIRTLDGVRSFDTRSCGSPTPYITDPPSPDLTDAQRVQVRDYAFGGSPASPPVPPCIGQPDGFPVLTADPPAPAR